MRAKKAKVKHNNMSRQSIESDGRLHGILCGPELR